MEKNTSLHGKNYATLSYLMMFGFTAIILLVNFFLYLRLQELFKERLQQRLLSIVETASVGINESQLAQIKGEESVGTQPYIDTVNYLREIREKNENLKYIYIFRKTDDPGVLQFVADADSIDPYAEIDLNGDGTIDESDLLNVPGDPYEVDEDDLIKHGFLVATVDNELIQDQWGSFLSAFAPISTPNGQVEELIGIDVEVSDYVRITNIALIPFGLSIIVLLVILFAQTTVLVRMWGSRVELLRELDRQKDELLSIVSHQLATPVSSVKWYLEMLLDGDVGVLSKEQQEYLNTMQSVTHNLADLVSMILDVSRIQLGKMKVDAQPLDLNLFFKEILFAIEPKAKEKEQKFDVSIPNDLPKAMLDKRLTRMTIENLLSNAVKYTPAKGTVKWFMELRGTMLYMEVRDTGCGIPEKDQKQIFGKLFRASNTGAIDGNGFGLYVAKGAIEAQGGKIWFESKENKGTTFFVELPLKSPPSEAK